MGEKLTFKGEVITLPEMPEPFYWQVNKIDIDLRKRKSEQNLGERDWLEGWAGEYSHKIHAVVFQANNANSAGYPMPTWQAALDYLAMRALLGGIEANEVGEL